MSFLLSSDGKRIYVAPIFPPEAPWHFVVGCTCCKCCSRARLARELFSGNVVIMRHSVGAAATSQIAATRVFSARNREMHPVRLHADWASPNLQIRAMQRPQFFLERERSTPGARSTDGKSLFHYTYCKGCFRNNKRADTKCYFLRL